MITHADPLVICIIAGGYVIFAIQVWLQAGKKAFSTNGGRAIMALVVVFVFCAISGYVSSLMPPGPKTWIFREILHWLLAFATIWLVFSNQGGAVAAMLDNERDR